MATYPTIVGISRTSWPGGTLSPGGTCTGDITYLASSTMAYPSSKTLEFPPNSFTKSVYDPSKGQKRNWKKIKESGEISFTPLKKSSTYVENFLVVRDYSMAGWKVHQHGCAATQTANRLGPLYGQTVWQRNSSIGEYANSIDSSAWNWAHEGVEDDITKAIITTQQSAFAQATSTVDVLTELAELKETLSFLQNSMREAGEAFMGLLVSDESTYRRARNMNAKRMLSMYSDKALKEFGKRWMAFRYAIMPIIYTVKDINQHMEEREGRYKTGRSKEKIVVKVYPYDYNLPLKGEKVMAIGESTITVRSMYKTRYDSFALQRLLSQSSFNPFTTAWELLPLSFVVDWFINVNDAIIAATRIDSSTQSGGTTSITRSVKRIHHLHDTSEDRVNFKLGAWMNQPAIDHTIVHTRNTHSSLQEIKTESYERWLFSNPSTEVVVDINLNWKRIVDSLVLVHKPIALLLRRL